MNTIQQGLLAGSFCALLLFPARPANRSAESCEQEKKVVDDHIALFDDLDFNVFSGRDWKNLSKSHADDIAVHWPDGHVTKGIQKHIQDLDHVFTYAPDTRIKQHPVKMGQGDWTAVYGIMEGTFTKPMKTPDGKAIPPTGKSFKLPMATLGHWKNGKMDEEYLFWDNETYMKQIGLK
jgi:hypothetical protein